MSMPLMEEGALSRNQHSAPVVVDQNIALVIRLKKNKGNMLVYITSYFKYSKGVRKWYMEEQRNPYYSSQDAVSVFQQQTGGVCYEGNLLFTPDLSSHRPRRPSQLEDCSLGLPHPDYYSMDFSILSYTPSSRLYCS